MTKTQLERKIGRTAREIFRCKLTWYTTRDEDVKKRIEDLETLKLLYIGKYEIMMLKEAGIGTL